MPRSPMCSGVAPYQASGSRLIQSSAGLLVSPKKNQCHQEEAKRASARSSASTIGTAPMKTSCVTESG